MALVLRATSSRPGRMPNLKTGTQLMATKEQGTVRDDTTGVAVVGLSESDL
jgi:hypothetical protein